MKLIQIATIINTVLIPNLLGENAQPISEDLSNVVDIGTALGQVTADQLKDYAGKFLAGIARTFFDDRIYEKTSPSLLLTSQEYGGVIQSIKSAWVEAEDDHAMSLVNGQVYDAGLRYKGTTQDVKIYEKDTVWRVSYCIAGEDFKMKFTNAETVSSFVAHIEATIVNSMNTKIHALEMSVLRALAITAKTREIKLVTRYNDLTGGQLTAEDALHDYEFLKWSAGVIIRLRDYITDPNKKYNDTTIQTFTPKADTRVTLLSEYATALETQVDSVTYHNELVSVGVFEKVNAWQTTGTDLLPDISVTGTIKGKLDGDQEETTIENVVGLIYDKMSAGISIHLLPTTADYNGDGDFTKYYNRNSAKYFIDSRNSAVLLTLN